MLTILSNTSAVQAVRHNRLGISQVVFYEPGTITLEKDLDLSVDQPCIVMIKHVGDTVEKITVSDPARKHDALEKEKFNISL